MVLPHWPGTPPPPHVAGALQLPQFKIPLQPSPAGPQVRLCCAQVSGTQLDAHFPATPPPPQLCPAGQVPQGMVCPHPSAMVPQLFPCAMQVVGTHPASDEPPLDSQAAISMDEVNSPNTAIEFLLMGPPGDWERCIHSTI